MFHHLSSLAKRWHRLSEGEHGSVAVSSAIALPVLLGMAGVAIEYGGALVTRAETQRVADLAAHAAVLAYGNDSDTAAMTQAAHNVSTLNGVAAGNVLVQLDPDGTSSSVVRVTITTPRPLLLSRLISGEQSVDVTVRSAAQLEQAQAACLQALDPAGPGISVSGGTSIMAAQCGVASNGPVSAIEGAQIVTETLSYDSDAPPQISGGASVNSPGGGAANIVRAATPDPLAGHEATALAADRLAAVSAMVAADMQAATPGPDIHFGYSSQTTQQQAVAIGCTASLSGSVWSMACPSGGTIALGNLTIDGGLSLDFAMAGTQNTTYSFSGSIRNTANEMRFGPGTYRVAHGIFTDYGTTVFAPGSSFRIGPAANGDAVHVGSGAKVYLGDETVAGTTFEVVGNITSMGGTCLLIGAAANHDIAGRLDIKGGLILGRGLYAIDGYLHLGAAWGGGVQCAGQFVSMRALGVTLLLSGKGAPGGNANCNGQAAFCAASGYDSMVLVPPSSGPFANIAVFGPLSPNVSAGASFAGGASGGRIAGAFYFPNGPIRLSGGASVSGAGTDCLQIIGASVTLVGGTAAASDCVATGNSQTAVARLIE